MGAKQDQSRVVRVRIEGSVQGVGFRYWTQRTATGLGLTGWVRNHHDGAVEALLCGSSDRVAQMLERCSVGPRAAQVTAVKVLAEGGTAPDGFDVLPTV